MLAVSTLSGFGVGVTAGGGPVEITYLDTVIESANQTTYTFSGVGIGAAGGNRTICVAAFSEGTSAPRVVGSISVGGSAATIHASANSNNVNWPVSLASVKFTSGTTADIIVVMDGSARSCCIAIWDVRNVGSISDTGNSAVSGPDPSVADITVQADGGLIGAAHAGGSTNTFTWTNLTERFDKTGATGNSENITGASDVFDALQDEITITCDPSASSQRGMALVAFAS